MSLSQNEQVIVSQFEECTRTLRRIPGGIRLGYFNQWPDIHYEARELAWTDPRPTRLSATPKQITRMEEALTWITWVNEVERKLIWLRAYRLPWRAISRETGLPRTSAQRYWLNAINTIAKRHF